MPVQSFAKVQVEDEPKKKRRRYNSDITMLVVGAEDGLILLHQTEEQSFKISGEITVADLREIGVDVEDWAARGLIAPLGQLAERAEETDTAVLFEEGSEGDEEPVSIAFTAPEPEFNDTIEDDGTPTNIVSQVVPDIEKVVRPKIKARK